MTTTFVGNGIPSTTTTTPKTSSKSRSRGITASTTSISLAPNKGKARLPPAPLPSTPEANVHQAVPTKGIQKIDRATLVKQKVKSYPRDREHFFNKVVQPQNSKNGKNGGPYYFVLNYNERLSTVTLCPMQPKGVLSGKRQGRPRYQCAVQSTSANWITAAARLYDAVPAFMVMKTPIVAQEAWDILGEP